MKASSVLASLLALSSSTTATQFLGADLNVVAAPLELVPRQDNGGNGNSNQQSSSAPPASASSSNPSGSSSSNPPDSTITTPPATSTASGSAPASSGSGSTTAGKTGSTQSKASNTLQPIDPQNPPGQGAMITPAAISGVPYYKVDETVTWVWNYTYLLRNPSAIDILATVPIAPSPFTIAMNQTFEPTQTFKWDTGKFNQETPLPIGSYTLIVYDAGATGGATAIPKAGYLGTWEQFVFGMYTKQANTLDVTAAVQCVTCNSASGLERKTMSGLLLVSSVTVASFYWFTGGLSTLL